MKKSWTLTDSDTGQYGRQLDAKRFEFKENGRDPEIIDVKAFNSVQVEGCINGYGYTLFKPRKHLSNIHELYGKEANWIIAECLFEMDI